MAWSGCGDAKGPDAAEPPAVHGEETPAKAAREPAAVEGAEPATKVEPAEPTTPGVRDDGEIVSAVSWFHGSLEQALAEAKAQDKLVLMDVGAYWCPPCHQLDEEVFVRPEVGEPLAAGYVAMHVDAEKGEGPELVERYHVQAFPTILVLEPSGLEKGRIVDFLPAEALLAALERLARGDNVLAELADAVQSDPDDLGKRYALGHALLLAADAEAAAPELEAVILVGESSVDAAVAKRLVALANKIRHVDSLGLAEIPSTRLLVAAARLIASGLPPRLACDVAIVQALTDDDDLVTALRDLVALVF